MESTLFSVNVDRYWAQVNLDKMADDERLSLISRNCGLICIRGRVGRPQ